MQGSAIALRGDPLSQTVTTVRIGGTGQGELEVLAREHVLGGTTREGYEGPPPLHPDAGPEAGGIKPAQVYSAPSGTKEPLFRTAPRP